MSVYKNCKLSLLLSILLLAFAVLSSKVGIIRDHLELTAGGRIRTILVFDIRFSVPSAMGEHHNFVLVSLQGKDTIHYINIAINL